MRTARRSYRPIFAQNLSTDGVGRLLIAYHKSASGAVVNDFRLKPGFLYTQVRAISARINQNYDGWPSAELKKSYRSFLGKPVFVNHQNFDPTKARGRVVASRYIESGDDKYIEVIQEIDAQRFPKLANEIRTGGLDSVSMGVEAGFTICSYCDNKASDVPDMCDHVLNHKGKTLRRRAKNGQMEDVLIYENCYKLGFFELSYVFEPADETAVVSKVLVASKNKPSRRFFAAVGHAGQSSDHPVGTPPEQYVIPFKERGYSGEEVVAYRNLHSKKTETALWSLLAKSGKHKNLVIGHSDSVHMPGASFFANPKGAERVKKNKVKEVHAGIRGVLGPVPHPSEMPGAPSGITYNPDQGDTFFQHRNEQHIFPRDQRTPVEETAHVHLAPDGRAYAFGFEGAQVGVPEGGEIEPFYREGGEIHPRYQQIGRDAMRRRAYGETEAPENVDTLRNKDNSSEHFHHYVESPKELQEPKLNNNIRSEGSEEDDRRAGASADFDPRNEKIVEPDAAHEDVIDDFLDWCDSVNVVPGQDSLDDYSNAYHLGNDDYQAVSDFLESQSNGAGPTNASQPVPHLSRRKMSNYRYAADDESLPFEDSGEDDYGDEGEFEPGAPPHDHDSDGDMDYEGEDEGYDEDPQGFADESADGGGDPGQLIEEFVSWCEQNGCEQMDQQALDGFDQEAQLNDNEYQQLSEMCCGDDSGSQEPPADPHQMMASRNGKSKSSSLKKRKAKRGSSMARESLASRGGRVASSQRLHRFADESGHFDSGPYDENNQGEQEAVFLSQTPGEESVQFPVPGDGTISNTENVLVARINAGKNSLQRDLVAWQRLQNYKMAGNHEFGEVEDPVNPYSGMPEGMSSGPGSFGPSQLANPGVPQHAASRQYYAADGGFPDATTVNPELSGTEEQDFRGDFEELQPSKVETQPKDASLKAFAAFDSWLRNTTGRTASQHGNANFIRRQAARWAGTNGYPVEVLFPALGTFLRQARKIEGGSTMRRNANESLEVAAPQDRIDVETPVSNTTDADAQASQFDLSDFGSNAGDGIANPDLDTGSQFWAPGEGVKESNRKADGVAAIRLAEAYIRAGLKPEGDKYNLVAQFQTMRHATVTDRTRLLEAVLKTSAFSRRVASAGSLSRGTAPRTSLPPGLMNGGTMSRSASVSRVAANDPSTDSDLFL
jgi:hypothetical protein